MIRVTYGAEEEWYTWDRGYSQVTVASPTVERETSGGEGGSGDTPDYVPVMWSPRAFGI